jgi:thiol-disulfide isomerase/thioredoxin
MKRGVLVFWAVILIFLIGGIGASFFVKSAPGQHDALAQCIANQGVKFYGAFWCPHCQRTKGLFGSSAKYLPYVECSTADGQGQLQICKDKKVTSYPTWIRPDGKILTGEHTLDEWAAFSGCTLSGQPTAFSNASSTSGTSTTVQ